MKKSLLFVSLSMMLALGSCGGSSNSNSNSNSEGGNSSEGAGTVVSDASNDSQDYSEYLGFKSEPAEFKVNGHMLELNIYPVIKKAAEKINDNANTELILLDEAGNKVATMHPFGRDSSFENALYDGDTDYKGEWTFIASFDTDEEAQQAAEKARKFKVIMPLAERVVKVNKYPDWNPVGTYEMTDGYGNKYALVLKKGGNAELENLEYRGQEGHRPTNGTWKQDDEEGFVKCDFFAGPFIRIGDHDSVSYPILTPDYFYADDEAYENDTDCLEVKKVS